MTGAEGKAPAIQTGDGFATTAWSLILAAGDPGAGAAALERLCRKHWRPLYIFIRKSGLEPAEAEDVTQDFFVFLLDRGWLQKADPTRGSFRAYLLTLLRNFLSNYRRGQQTGRRRAALSSLSLDTDGGEHEVAALMASVNDPARAFDASWAQGVLHSAWSRLEEEQRQADKAAVFAALRPYVTQAAGPGEYEELARRLALRRGQVAVLIHRLSRRFGELVRAEVAETLADPADLEAELRHLLEVSAA